MNIITISSLPIKLGQFLKYANIAQDGLEAKLMIQNGLVSVNGKIETQRGRKIVDQDIIQVDEKHKFQITIEK